MKKLAQIFIITLALIGLGTLVASGISETRTTTIISSTWTEG